MSATHLSATSADPAATKRNDTADTADTVGEAAKATPKSSATKSSAESVLPEPASPDPDPENSETTADRVASASASRDEIEISSGGSADRERLSDDHLSPRRSTETVECPPGFVGRVIGKGGETIKGLQAQSGAHITVDQNFPEGAPRVISISGPPGCVAIAKRLVEELLRGGGARLGGGVGPGQAQQSVRCPKEMVGRVIGRGGETVKGLQAATGARIQIDQSASPCVVTITGNPRCVDAAARAVADVVRGGSTAAYGAANQRREAMAAAATYRRRSLAHSAAAYGDARFGASRIDARFAPRDPLDAHAMANAFHSHSMARLEHQFASMGYHGVSHPTRGTASAASGGGVPTEGHPRASAALYGFAGNRAPAEYGYGPGPGPEAEYAYGEYGVDPAGALYAMQMQAHMQAHMMGMGVGVGPGMGAGMGPHDHGAEGRGGVGLPREGPGESPMGAGAWMPREQMAQFQQFQQEMMAAQAQHAGAFGPSGARGPAAGDRDAAAGTVYAEETRTSKQSGGGSGSEAPKAPPAGAEPAGASPPAGPRPPDEAAAWTPPPPL
jgi:far upstream element-binding protein